MTKKHLLALALALVLLTSLASPALAAETASVIRLTKTTGTVEISKSSGKSVSLLKNMRLYNGYHVVTSEESYAWVNLDDSKLIKEAPRVKLKSGRTENTWRSFSWTATSSST
ncbi:hypothetical protein [uncultured Oscillibacter sp.]|jgi:hypothetical protein|uniref:hypothetical protein n=1 Tax=uncultured Oscillibacter sp. TaxID=876091 RepID=UPI0025DC891B|nr:hypothetical protein [uncultured Oscillibacter sp.]